MRPRCKRTQPRSFAQRDSLGRCSTPIFDGDGPAPSAPLAQNSVPNLGDLHADIVRYYDFVNGVPQAGESSDYRIISVYRMGWQEAFDSCKPLIHRSSGLGNLALVDQTLHLLRSGQIKLRNVSAANHRPSNGIVAGDIEYHPFIAVLPLGQKIACIAFKIGLIRSGRFPMGAHRLMVRGTTGRVRTSVRKSSGTDVHILYTLSATAQSTPASA